MSDRRGSANRTAMLLLAVLLATAGCGTAVGGTPDPEASPKEQMTVDPATATGTTALECGQPFRPPARRGPTLTGRFPATAAPGEQAVTGTVELASRTAVRGVATPGAEVFLVRDGRVVTVPMAQDSMGVRLELGPGRTERLPGVAALVSCEPGGEPVRPGAYELYARVVITPDDGTRVESFGGPWPLEVR